MTDIAIRFERIGRHRNVPDLPIPEGGWGAVAAPIYDYARRYLMSSDITIGVSTEGDYPRLCDEVVIHAGMRPAGHGTVVSCDD